MSCVKRVDDYIFSWEELEKRRPGNLNAQIWQLVQSSNTKAVNLEYDFTEMVATIQVLGWSDGEGPIRCWVEEKEERVFGPGLELP